MRRTGTHGAGGAEAIKQLADVAALDLEIKLRTIAIAKLPATFPGQIAVGIGELNLVELPDPAFIVCDQLKPSETTRPDGKIIGNNVQRRQFFDDLLIQLPLR